MMPRIGDIALEEPGALTGAAVAFELHEPSAREVQLSPAAAWVVELRPRHRVIVARTADRLDPAGLLAQGFEICQRALDLVSVDEHRTLAIADPGRTHTLFFREGTDRILRHVFVAQLGLGMQGQITVTDKDGKLVPQPERGLPHWHPSFRFYRLSQLSRDPFEAYRNLYLAFEAALDSLCPKNPSEREKDWLRRALNQLDARAHFAQFVPPGIADPVAYIIGTQYDAVRVKLFHGKPGKTILPHEEPNPSTVTTGYEALIRIYRGIATSCLGVAGGGGVFTYAGFRLLTDGMNNQGVTLCFSDDPTPPSTSDTRIAVTPYSEAAFPAIRYVVDEPGRAMFVGRLALGSRQGPATLFKAGCVTGNVLSSVSHVPDGLELQGADFFEVWAGVEMLQTTGPRSTF
jgi:hypothetical protein